MTGAVLAALAGGTAAYLLYNNRGAKNRKRMKGWVLKMKDEVLDQIDDFKEIGQDAYEQIVESVAKRYEGMKNISRQELSSVVDDLKKQWNRVTTKSTSV